jgi:lipopolysaccharide-induced tumor necrosis factor-alpha factor
MASNPAPATAHYPPPGAHYPPAPTLPVVVSVALPIGSSVAVMTRCYHCNQNIMTRTEPESGLLTWLMCGGIACFGGFFGCCLIPFCIDSCKDVNHFCPSCGAMLGHHKRL